MLADFAKKQHNTFNERFQGNVFKNLAMKIFLPFFLLTILLIGGCEVIDFENTEEIGVVDGVRPIYVASENWDEIISTDPQPIKNLGKIYYKDPYIFVNERYKGIHILDNTNPSNPVALRFIQIVGNEDIAIKGDILYADNITDLVAIDISNFQAIEVKSRIKDLYSNSKKSFPDGFSGYFECVDSEKGIVVGWESATLDNPKCVR